MVRCERAVDEIHGHSGPAELGELGVDTIVRSGPIGDEAADVVAGEGLFDGVAPDDQVLVGLAGGAPGESFSKL